MFVGREREIELLREPNWRDKAVLIVVYGRRRVGKTALVEEAYGHGDLWQFDGIEGGSKQVQLSHFADQLAAHDPAFRQSRPQRFDDWSDAFDSLAAALDKKKSKEITVFLDEFQWMARMRAPLVSLFKSYWDLRFSRNPKHRIVLCGSVSSFMVKKVIRSRALYGRVSIEIDLAPLNLREIHSFFQGQRTDEEVLETAMCLGGIPEYLQEMNPRYSLMQNLNEYALRPNGYFFKEFQRVFISHFGKNPVYETILHKLSAEPCTPRQLAAKCRTHTGGTFTELLADLELAGLIERYTPLGKDRSSRHIRYRIQDEYLHFYFRFIKSHERDISAGQYNSAALLRSRSFAQWRGYAFERLCRRHANQIADALRFSAVQHSAGTIFEPSSEDARGAQIDLAFDRVDRVMTLCEMKYVDRLAGRAIIDAFENKCRLLLDRYPRRSFQKVLVCGNKVPLPDALNRYFDRVLWATDLFFS